MKLPRKPTGLPSVSIVFDASQFPENVRRDLLTSLRTRQINHKFHYNSYQQAAKWLALHEAFSPARQAKVKQMYGQFLDRVATERAGNPGNSRAPSQTISIIGLGCGGGWKDARLIQSLLRHKLNIRYIPVDVGAPMVLAARATCSRLIPPKNCQPVVADLATSTHLGLTLDNLSPPRSSRIITFFGMLPNFEPDKILPRLAGLARPGDILALSANLAPGPDYRAGVQQVLPQYDNAQTRDWLQTLFSDLGFDSRGGSLKFCIAAASMHPALLRIEAHYHVKILQQITVEGKSFQFPKGAKIRAFYSYRQTPELVADLMKKYGLSIIHQTEDSSGQEGLFLLKRTSKKMTPLRN